MMRASTLRKFRWWCILIARAAKGIGFAALILSGLMIVGIGIFWNADLLAARDRIERAKIALFGTWPESNKFHRAHQKQLAICHWGSDGSVGVCVLKNSENQENKELANVK